MDFSQIDLTPEMGITYEGTLGVLDKDKTRFISDSQSLTMLCVYVVLMFYLIGGLNIIKIYFLYPCLEDLCSIYVEVLTA